MSVEKGEEVRCCARNARTHGIKTGEVACRAVIQRQWITKVTDITFMKERQREKLASSLQKCSVEYKER